MENHQVPEIIEQFGNYQIAVKNRSVRTVYQYRQDLTIFLRYLKLRRAGIDPADAELTEEIDISDIPRQTILSVTREDILAFIVYTANSRGNKADSRARKLSCLRTFYKYCYDRGYIENNPAKEIDSPQVKPALPKFLTLEESLALLEAVRNDSESKSRERDYAILTLFLNCGMRLSELDGINLSDLDPDLRSLRVLGKGSKERVVYLNPACRDALTVYLKVRANIPDIKDKNALFISRLRRRMSIQMIQKMVEKYLKAAGLEHKHYSTHKLRHTAATLMYRTGQVDIRTLKDILGHEQLNTTQIYTHVSNEQMEEAMNLNPLADIKQKKKEE
ncbi:MAG: tyrosine recombinase XerC [Clostridia bacterium]|nr:tyrosine recombinase XerC [Clostridia bacterium]